MGADLYIREISDPLRQKYQPLFDKWVEKRNQAINDDEKKKAQAKVSFYYDKMDGDGYFRDSYNGSSLLWQYELSWWNDVSEGLCNKKGELDADGIKSLIKMMDKNKDIFNENMAKILNGHNDKMDNAADMDNAKGRQSWVNYFVKKDKLFRKFLRKALKLNVSIDCSL